jgi:SRSO17 transposase
VGRYVLGLLSNTDRKNGWRIAESVYERGPQGDAAVAQCGSEGCGVVRDELRDDAVEHLDRPDRVLIADETGFVKKGTTSAGVARQPRENRLTVPIRAGEKKPTGERVIQDNELHAGYAEA